MERVGQRTCVGEAPSVLNLKQWIPQKDVIKMILKYLNQADWKLVWAAHNKLYEKRQLWKDYVFWNECARHGYFDLIMWGLGRQLIFQDSFYDNAAIGGHLRLIEWGLEQAWNEIPFPETSVVHRAIEYGHVSLLEFFLKKRFFYVFSSRDYTRAARTSALSSLEFLKRNRIAISDCWGHHIYEACSEAAAYGQLDALKWLRSNGFPWDESVVTRAVRHNHLHILKWAIENGCRWRWGSIKAESMINMISSDLHDYIEEIKNL